MSKWGGIDFDCEKTWALFKEGKTKGIFQLESNLGRSWSKRVEPRNIEELSALISLIRPGCLKAKNKDGKTMTQQYVDCKHGHEEVTYLHPLLEEILKPTYGVIVYQEQSMRIAQRLAGFNLQEADELRKAIGKKKADLMAKIKNKFVDGCVNNGIDEKIAQEIFGQIEKSARYAFNKSHAVAYAVNAYLSAWHKAHSPIRFFTSYLYYASEKQDPHQEIYELVSEAKLFDITVKIPKIDCFSEKFAIRGNDIYFGIKDIKSLTGVTGDKVMQAIKETEEKLNKKSGDFTWLDILIYLSPNINSTAFKALCSVGFFSTKKTSVSRNKALYDYLIFSQLTKAELTWVENKYQNSKWSNLMDCFTDLAPVKKQGGGTSKAERSQIIFNEVHFLKNPPYSLDDTPTWIVEQEKKFLGCPISLSRIETSDTSSANTSCKDILNGKVGKDLCVVGSVNRLATCKVKRGKTAGQLMAFLTIEDDSCSIDNVIIFPETRQKYEHILYEGNNLLFCGEVSKKDNSFIVQKIHEI